MIASEALERVRRVERAEPVAEREGLVELRGALGSGRVARVRVTLDARRVTLDYEAEPAPFRLGVEWQAHPAERFTGLGARHCERLDQTGRCVRLGADRRYTGPDCPPEMLDVGGIPQGDYAPLPWLLASRGYGLWETAGEGLELELGPRVRVSGRAAAGPFRLHLYADPRPAARLRRWLRDCDGVPALLPEWAYGHWKSRDVYEHQRAVVDDFEGYRRQELPLDAIVIDSPWETQYNTWEPNPHQFEDFEGMVRRFRADGVRTVVWVTPWVNLESADGQRPPDRESERLHREPASNYAPGAGAGHFVRDAQGRPLVARWWMGTGSAGRLQLAGGGAVVARAGAAGARVRSRGHQGGRRRGLLLPARRTLRRRPQRRLGGLGLRRPLPALDAARARAGAPGARRALRPLGLDRPRLPGRHLERRPGVRLLVAARARGGHAHRGGQRPLELVARRGRLPGRAVIARCPKELLLRWAQFGCFTPLMHAHGRFQQEALTYDSETLRIYRAYLLLHERLVPYTRSAAATAARCGLPIVRPLLLTDPADERAWTIANAYGYGPALWVAPVLHEGARERELELPRGEWLDLWTVAQ